MASRRFQWMVTGALVTAWISACGDDASTDNSAVAGEAGEAQMAGSPPENEAGSGHTPNGGKGASAGAGGIGTTTGGVPGGEPGGAASAGEGGAAGAPADPDDVHGQLLGNFDPISGAVIAVDGVTTQTDENGRFTVKDVAESYRLVAALPQYKMVLVYEAVTSRNPIAQLGVSLEQPVYPYEASYRGKLTGPGGSALSEALTDIGIFASDHPGLAQRIVSPPEGFDLGATWKGSSAITADLWAIQQEEGDFLGFARRTVVLEDGELYGSVNGDPTTDVELADVTEQARDFKLTVADGWQVTGAPLLVGPFRFYTGIVAAGDHVVSVPAIDAPLSIEVLLAGADTRGGKLAMPLPESGAIEIDIPALPEPVSPPDAANAVTQSTVFSWTKTTGFLTSVHWLVNEWNIYLYSPLSQSTIPDLSALGVSLDGTLTGSWAIGAVGPATTAEEMMDIEMREYASSYRAGVRGYLSAGVRRNFAAP